MTTSVTVKTRGLGATVQVAGETVQIGPNQERRFDTDDTMSLSLRQETQDEATAREAKEAEERVPGSAENDGLIKEVDPAKLDELSGNTTRPQGNMTGATETAATTDEAAVSDPPARRPGR